MPSRWSIGIEEGEISCAGYADNVAILMRDSFLQLQEWSESGAIGLIYRLIRKKLVIFRYKYKIGSIKKLVLNGIKLMPAGSMKYL